MPFRTVASVAFCAIILCPLAADADLRYFLDPGDGFRGTTLSEAGFIPPDTMGAVGRDHVVELLNGQYKVFDKSSGSVQASSSLNSFWTSAGVSFESNSFDPRVIYDPFSERYFASSVDNGGSANSYLFAVSNSDNPLDGWTGTNVDSDSDDSHWADFDTLGFNADGVYLAANMFDLDGNDTRTSVLAFDKSPLLASTPSFSFKLHQDESIFQTGGAIQPIVDYDNTSNPYDMIGVWDGDELRVSTLTGTPSSSTLNTGVATVFTNPVTDPPDADQPGGVTDIETNDIRLASNVIQINGSYWGTQCVDQGGRAAIRWFEIDPATYTVVQEGFITDPELDLYFPSIAVSEDGFAAVGFSGSSSSQYASTYVVHGELQNGTMQFGDPLLLRSGNATYDVTAGGTRNRWGDYSATVVDPYNPTVFWTFQEYAYAEDNWGTWVQRLETKRVPEPGTMALLAIGLGGMGWLRRRRAS